MDTGIIVAIVGSVSIVGILAYVAYRANIFRRKKIKYPAMERRNGSFTVSGNLVQELSHPITDLYIVIPTLLGRGSSADVIIGEHIKQKRRYAIKMIDISRKEVVWRYDREKNFLKDLEHSNICRLYEVYTSPSAMFFVTELCTGGHLGHHLKVSQYGYLEEHEARRIIRQILSAVIHCHSQGICHRDIKLQNVILESNQPNAQVKLVDFGNAVRFIGKLPLVKVVGTTYTAAPEVFRKSYDERCDIWSLGVVSFILLSGKRPFERPAVAVNGQSREAAVIGAILKGEFDFSARRWKDVSDEALDFVQCCMHLDYQTRTSAIGLLDHPWLVYAPTSGMLSRKDNVIHISRPFMSKSSSDVSVISTVSATTLSLQGSDLLRKIFQKAVTKSDRDRHLMMARLCFMLPIVFSLSLSRIDQYREVFQEIDRNANGRIERDEFRVVVAQTQGDFDYTMTDIDQVFDLLDQDWMGSISYLSFLAISVHCDYAYDVVDMEQGFRLLDRGRKGYLTREDVLHVLKTVSFEEYYAHVIAREPQSAQALKSLLAERSAKLFERMDNVFRATDLNHDMVLSYPEYLFALSPKEQNIAGMSRESLIVAPVQDPLAKRRQSDGTVRLEGTSFGTRQRVSFMRQPRIYVPARPSQPEKVDVQCDPWRGFPPARPSRSFFNFGGCGPSAYGADPGNEVYMQIQHIARDSLPVSFIEDSPPVTVPRRQPSMQSVGTDPPLPIYEETPVPPSSGAPEKQPSSAQLSSEPPQRGSLVRRLSSAIFNIPARARARTSPALLFSVQLRGSSLELVPNPHAAQAAAHLPVYLRSGGSSRVSSAGRSALGMDLKPSQMIKEGEGSQGTAIKETNDSQDDDERVWNESDDSLDRTSFKYMHPEDEVPQHILQDIRRKSSGQSLDSHMFRQQLIETMMFSPTSSSKKTPFSYIQTIDADSSKEHGKMPWSAQGSSRVHPVVPSPAAAAAAGDGAVQVMDVDEDALGDANV